MAKNQNMQKLMNTFFAISLFTSCCLHQSCYGQKNSKLFNQKEKYFEGMFVFGTSLVDNGNNNYIKTSLSKANYKPYGIDFPFGPTGRFSNGKNVADLIGDLLHLPLIPPFVNSNTKHNNIFHGVNYCSGGSGILDGTGSISRLYDAGGRKYAVLTVYPIGCTPVVKQQAGSQRYVQLVNKAAHYYNTQLINLVYQLKQKMPGSEFVIVNAYKIVRDIIKNPVSKGFSNATGPCCQLQEIMGVGILCKENGRVCKNTSSYVFFDGQHNTEAVNAIIAAKAFYSNRKTEAYPFNLQKLAQL